MKTRCDYVDTPYGQVHLRTSGSRSDSLPVVLLHQTASHSAMYESIMAELGTHTWCIAPDTPGYGGTPHPEEAGDIAHYAKVLRAALKAMNIDRCWLFGHHTGASIAVQMLTDEPEFAEKLILSGPPYLTQKQIEAIIPKVCPVRLETDGSHFMDVWTRIRSKAPNAPIELTHREAVSNLQVGPRYLEAYTAVFEHDFAGQLAALETETLVIAGADDTIRGSLEPAFNALQNGHIRTFGEGGTYICDTHPELIIDALTRFFTLGEA